MSVLDLWKQHVEDARRFRASRTQLLLRCASHEETSEPSETLIVPVLKFALLTPDERGIALETVGLLTSGEQMSLFEELLQVALDHDPNAGRNCAEEIIAKLPEAWVGQHFRPAVERMLRAGAGIDTGLLSLCILVDRRLAFELAELAKASEDAYEREIGEHFLKLHQRL